LGGKHVAVTLADHLDLSMKTLYPEIASDYQWLLLQTLYTGSSRRSGIAQLPIDSSYRGLDIGCGFGALTIEMAAAFGCTIEGVDGDQVILDYAKILAATVPQIGSRIKWVHAVIEHLPYRPQSQDFVTARFVFQHTINPKEALQELWRVIRPHGLLYIEDIDEQLILQYPEPPPAWQHILTAFSTLQRKRGGDRAIGRKLPVWLTHAGFQVQWVNPVWQSATYRVNSDSADFQWEIRRIQDQLPELYDAGLLTSDEWNAGINALLDTNTQWAFVGNASLQILALRN
jgi:ubiquinone/menaquinone biosynthesis C-methylase UbiE